MPSAPALFDKDFQPMEATVFESNLVMYDARTRPDPFAILVDAINTYKLNGMHHAKPSIKEAQLSLEKAARELAGESLNPLALAWGVSHALYAFHCLRRMSPVMLLPPHGNTAAAVEAFRGASQKKTDREIAIEAIRGLATIGTFLPNDEHAARRLSIVRSQAWSADVPGIAVLVDCQLEKSA